jgi:hypothetical protein
MKYWIFQNNQVLGPYGMDDLCKVSTFSPESLVCPEGRRGTSMGDWQRAGMVPDLSVALVRATATTTQTATLPPVNQPAAAPAPEPTLKDMAVLESLQGKVAALENVVLQLQQGLRAKDGELSALRAELTSKHSETNTIRSEANAIRSEAIAIRNEAADRQREVEERKREAETLKRQLAGVEDRLSSLRLLSETLDKAVEEEKRVEQDVEKQGETISALTHEIENLSRQITERHGGVPMAIPVAALAPEPAPFISTPVISTPAPAPDAAAPIPAPAQEDPGEITFISAPEPEAAPAPVPAPEPTVSFAPPLDTAAALDITPEPAPAASHTFDPMSFGGSETASFSPAPAVSDISSFGADTLAPLPEPDKSKKKLILGVATGVIALAMLGLLVHRVLTSRKPQTPVSVLEPAAVPEPTPVPVSVAPDPRQSAVDFAKAWPLPSGKTLGRALEELAPTIGNLSPWMAETLAGGRVQVNYFARGTAPGAPTIAYEFEVDLEGKTLVGRNTAAKSVLAGKAAPPPAPPKPKPIKVKAKIATPAAAAPAKAPKAAAAAPARTQDSLNSMLGEPGADGEGDDHASDAEAPPAEKPAKAAPRKAKGGKPAADESLLDDLLKE